MVAGSGSSCPSLRPARVLRMMTEPAAVTGSAAMAPTTPKSVPPISTDSKEASGVSSTVRAKMRGAMR